MGDQILYRFGAFAGAGEQGQRRALLVIPLTWSHAMYVLVLAGLKEAGVL